MRLLPQFDVSYTILLELCFCLLTARRAHALIGGFVAGLLLLLNPATVLITSAWLLWLFVSRRVPWRAAARYSVLAATAASLCAAPWLVRNYRVFGAFAMRTNFGLTLYNSNNDCASPSLYEEAVTGCIQRTFPVDSESEATLIRGLGEVPYDRLRTDNSFRWILAHPRQFAHLTGARMVDFWFPDPRPDLYTCYAIWAITLLSIPGIVLAVRARQPIAAFVLCVWVIYPLLYYVVVSCDRYRYPILWTSLLPAGYALRTWLFRTSHELSAERAARHTQAGDEDEHRAQQEQDSFRRIALEHGGHHRVLKWRVLQLLQHGLT
jgi:hypothetical protein